MKRRGTRAIAAVAALALAMSVAASCGDDGGGSAAGGTTTSAEEPSTGTPSAVVGCDDAVTDIADLSDGRAPARCDSGAPAPVPLETRQKVVLANAFQSEYVAPIILAEQLGEFEKENLEVEIVALGMEDALPQIRNGEIDAANGAPNASFFNVQDGSTDIKWVLGNFFPRDAGNLDVAQTGLWARSDVFSDPADPDAADLAGRRVASAVGLASVIAYPLAEAFSSAGIDPTEVEFAQVPSTDMVAALQNQAVDAAWLLDPFWTQVQDSEDFVLVASQPPGEPLGGIFFGHRLLNEDREVGEALLRAMIRTVNTYLADDYHEDDTVMQAISDITSIPVEQIRATPALAFDWEIREGTTDRAQHYFREFGVLNQDDLTEDVLVDRTLYLSTVGAS